MSDDRADAVTMRLRLDIAYDGTDFHGWAVQPGRRTVAGVLGEALAILFRVPVSMVVAGRTDAGVHATGQVAHVDVDPAALAALAPRHLVRPAPQDPVTADSTDASRPDARPAGEPGSWAAGRSGARTAGTHPADSATAAGLVGLRRRLAGLLPPDIRVPGVSVAPAGFDARFSALRRHYRYRVASSEWGVAPLHRFDTLAWRRPLDVAAMQAAADALTGLRDFAAYCKPREGATTIRDLERLAVTWVSPDVPSPPLPPSTAGGDPGPSNGSVVLARVGDLARTTEPLLGQRGPLGRSPESGDVSGVRGDGRLAGDDALGPALDQEALVVVDVTADAFCHSMVRSLVGALLAVGDGRFPIDRPVALLTAGRRTAEIAVAPAHGLTLVGVDYPVGAELAARARATRALRAGATKEMREGA